MGSILAYMTLSLWRIERTYETLAVFIVFSCINTCYTWVWDVMMDWSLFTLSSKHPGLRDMLAYKPVFYYLAIVIDFILRSAWIFYVIFRQDLQHSSLVSFAIAFAEVFRRAMWTAFRVENDHCYNMVANKAVREVGLPYRVGAQMDHTRTTSTTDETETDTSSETGTRTSPDLESGNASVASGSNFQRSKSKDTPALQSLRRRQTGTGSSPSIRSRVGHLMSSAHAQDFERTKSDEVIAAEEEDEEDEEEELDEDEHELEAYKSRTRNA